MADGPVPTSATAAAAQPGRGFLAWLDKNKILATVGTGLLGIVLAILTTALTPLGEDLREWIDPTSATVEGAVFKGQVPVVLAEVVLDGKRTTRTLSMGEFFFTGVRSGVHSLRIVDGGLVVFERRFAVDRRAVRVPIQTDLAVAVPIPDEPSTAAPPTPPEQPGATEEPVAASPAASPMAGPIASPRAGATPMASPASTESPSPSPAPRPTPDGAGKPALAVELGAAPVGGLIATVRVVAPPAVLGRIAQVTYVLPETFNPSIVTRYSAADGFALVFVPAEGETAVAATVVFAAGRAVDLAATVRP